MPQTRMKFNRRRLIGAGAAVVASAGASSLLAPTTTRADNAPQASAALPNGSGFYRFKIDDFQATVISDGYGTIPIGPIFAPNASESDLAATLKANFMQAMVQGTSNVLVVDTGRERILVDSGWGEKLGNAFGKFAQLDANLRRAGISPDSIDLVVISHAHLDHIGGLTKAGAAAFPKATVVFVDKEWSYWTGNQFESDVMRSSMPDPFKQGTIRAAKEQLPPVANRVHGVKQDGEIVPGVHFVSAPGHSPAHAAILFSSGSDQFMYLADVAHHPVTSLQHPEWKPVFDYDPELSIKTRKSFLDRAATDRLTVMAYHFPFPAIGHVVKQQQAFRWEPVQWTW
jgi:glyoxylase-like metal-dependent hydrolase (beta-lactamase superfamily II)